METQNQEPVVSSTEAATPAPAPETQNPPTEVVANEAAPAPATEETSSADAPVDETTTRPDQPKHIKELITQRKKRQAAEAALQQAEAEKAYYKGLAEGRGAGTGHPTPAAGNEAPSESAPTAPVLENFETFDAYERAKDDYLVRTAEHRFMERQRLQVEAERRAAEVRQQAEVHRSFQERLEQAAERDPDILSIAEDPTLPVSAAMVPLLHESDVSPQILRWLHNNRKEAGRIAQLPPVLAARELGMVEARIKFAPKPEPPKRVSAAPEPIAPVAATSPATVDENDLPMDQWIARRNKVDPALRRGR